MAFNFGFSGDDMEVDQSLDWDVASASSAGPSQPGLQGHPGSSSAKETERPSVPSRELDLDSMLSALPDRISFSTIRIPGGEGKGEEEVVLPRRDLFDARFQILHEKSFEGEGEAGAETTSGGGQGTGAGEDDAVVGTESDLIPGLYEGGLKTWECSLDLVSVLSKMSRDSRSGGGGSWLRGKRIVELGCGTALPSLYLFQLLLQSQSQSQSQSHSTDAPTAASPSPTTLHLCDFNSKVLELVTLPNLLLIFYFHSERETFGEGAIPSTGEVDLTPELITSFRRTLDSLGLELRFHAGPWEGIRLSSSDGPAGTKADLVLTSETTYNLSSVGPLVRVLRGLSRRTAAPSLSSSSLDAVLPDGSGTCVLVSTKNYYFGLGGGVHAFVNALAAQEQGGESGAGAVLRGVWDRKVLSVERGVARCVLSVGWEKEGE